MIDKLLYGMLEHEFPGDMRVNEKFCKLFERSRLESPKLNMNRLFRVEKNSALAIKTGTPEKVILSEVSPSELL